MTSGVNNGGISHSAPRVWEWIALAMVLVIGSWLRVHDIGDIALFGDENFSRLTVELSYGDILRTFDKYGSHNAFPLMQRAALDLFGQTVASYRLPAVIAGILGLLATWFVGRRLVGPVAAALAAATVAVSPIMVFYARFARSYGWVVLLGLVLVGFLERCVRGDPAWRKRRAAGVIVCAGLLPWFHLSSSGFVATLGPAALAATWWGTRRIDTKLLRPTVAFGLAALLCGLLFLPALKTARENLMQLEQGGAAFDWLEVPGLLAGGLTAGIIFSLVVPVSLAAFLRARPRRGILLLAAIGGPVAALLLIQPYGMAYAWSRYLIVALPFACMLFWWGVAAFVERLVAAWSRASAPASLATGLSLAIGLPALVLLHMTGPLSPGRPDDAPFSNTYLAMHPLPAFDAPFDGTPDFYRKLADAGGDLTIIESPDLSTRAVLLLRNYLLQHGCRVLIGWAWSGDGMLKGGPYIPMRRDEIRNSKADFLILHLDFERELESYWDFVYKKTWPAMHGPAGSGLMERHRSYFHRAQDVSKLRDWLQRTFGPPCFSDEFIAAWDLRKG